MPQISDLCSAKLTFGEIDDQLSSTQSFTDSPQVLLPRVIVDNHIICVCFAILDIWDDFVDKALKSSSSIFHTRGHDFVLVHPFWCYEGWNLLSAVFQWNLPESFKKVEFRYIFGFSNFVDKVVHSWDRKSVCLSHAVYFSIICKNRLASIWLGKKYVNSNDYCSVQWSRTQADPIHLPWGIIAYLDLAFTGVVLKEQHHRHPHHGRSDLSWRGNQETGLYTRAVASPGPGLNLLQVWKFRVQVPQHIGDDYYLAHY